MRKIIKLHKKKRTIELKSLGFIIPLAKITRGMNRKNGSIGGLDKCEFDGECDYCNKPKKGSYVSISRGMDFEEADFYICGKCAVRTYYKEYLANLSHWSGFAKYHQQSM